jgi:hypothetical protein
MSYDVTQCFTDTQPVARKEHRYCECQGTIFVGEAYHRADGIWCGEPNMYKVCVDCEALRKELDRDVKDQYKLTPFEGVSEGVIEADTPELLERFIEIKEKRGANLAVTAKYRDVLSRWKEQQ